MFSAAGNGNDKVQHKFFSKRQSLEFIKSVFREGDGVSYSNVDGFIGAILSSGQATLRELQEYYTLEEAFDLWEIVAVNRYNEIQAIKAAKPK